MLWTKVDSAVEGLTHLNACNAWKQPDYISDNFLTGAFFRKDLKELECWSETKPQTLFKYFVNSVIFQYMIIQNNNI